MQNKTFASRLGTWFHDLPIKDPIDRGMAGLVQVLLLGFMFIVALSGVLNVALPSTVPWQATLLRTLIFICIIGIPFILLRRGYFRASVVLIIALLLALETYAVVSINLRSIAETLTFFTLAILLAGSVLDRKALVITFLISAFAVILGVFQESDPVLRDDSIVIAANFILLHGLISLLLYRFGVTLRVALHAAQGRETHLQNEIIIRKNAEVALQRSTEQLEILHEIDRSLLSARSPHAIAGDALIRIRKLIDCPRASVTLIDMKKQEASFLATNSRESVTFPSTPIPFQEFGQRIIDKLQQNQPWVVDNVLEDPQATELDKKLANENGIYAWLSLPLCYQGQLIGALNLGRGRGQPFTRKDAEVAHDVANQLAIALQQTNLYNELQNELAERKKLISQLEANNAELERFTYTVSHDLRNPLVTIKGFLGMLEKDLQEGREDKVTTDLQRIANAADKMHALLIDLLELSRVGRIVNPPEEVDLNQVIQEAIETLDAHLRSKHIVVHSSLEFPIVYGDRVRLREVFENLIDNAAKYTGDQPNPLIEIGMRNDDGEAVFFVKDNGMGIEPQFQKRIFSLFEKLNPTSEGTGVGLALIKRIIEVHGGKIWVESEGVGKGSTFYFTIPDSRKNNR
jgi:signal transduction histidine kinase